MDPLLALPEELFVEVLAFVPPKDVATACSLVSL